MREDASGGVTGTLWSSSKEEASLNEGGVKFVAVDSESVDWKLCESICLRFQGMILTHLGGGECCGPAAIYQSRRRYDTRIALTRVLSIADSTIQLHDVNYRGV